MEKSAEPQLYLDKIENLNVSYPDWPFALVRLGRAYLLLEDLHGALEQFEHALSLLSPVKDQKFALYFFVRTLRPKKVSLLFEYYVWDVTDNNL
jgi:tetratricopeptide (TPR) repeat protein